MSRSDMTPGVNAARGAWDSPNPTPLAPCWCSSRVAAVVTSTNVRSSVGRAATMGRPFTTSTRGARVEMTLAPIPPTRSGVGGGSHSVSAVNVGSGRDATRNPSEPGMARWAMRRYRASTQAPCSERQARHTASRSAVYPASDWDTCMVVVAMRNTKTPVNDTSAHIMVAPTAPVTSELLSADSNCSTAMPTASQKHTTRKRRVSAPEHCDDRSRRTSSPLLGVRVWGGGEGDSCNTAARPGPWQSRCCATLRWYSSLLSCQPRLPPSSRPAGRCTQMYWLAARVMGSSLTAPTMPRCDTGSGCRHSDGPHFERSRTRSTSSHTDPSVGSHRMALTTDQAMLKPGGTPPVAGVNAVTRSKWLDGSGAFGLFSIH